MTSFYRFALSLAVLLGAVSVTGCSSGGGGGIQPPPEQQTATPAIAPATGTFTAAQSVTISDATAGAAIYYTTDGTTPTIASSIYSKAFTVSKTTTVEALALAPGYTDSNIATSILTINISQTATPVITPATGTFTAAQSVTISDSTTGAVIYYTTDSTTPTIASPVYSKAFTVSKTTTIEALALASGYANSNIATSTLTINIPQSISLPPTLLIPMGNLLVLDTSVVTASASCDPSYVTATVTINDSDKSTTGGSLASWSADSSNNTYGTISSGNTFSQSGVNTYTIKLICGTATASSQLTVSDPAPTITAVSCSPSESTSACVVKSTSSFTSTITGTNFIVGNYTTLAQWPGTEAHSVLGKCPATMLAGQLVFAASWYSLTEITQDTASNNATLGTWYYYVFNPPTGASTYINDPSDPGGTGGGWACLDDALTVVANSSSSATSGVVTLESGSNTVPGTLSLRSTKTGQVNWQTSLDLGSTMTAISGDIVYIPNKNARNLSVVNLSTHTVQTISTDGLKPWIAAVSPKTGALYLAAESEKGYSIQQYSEKAGLSALTSNGHQITDLVADSDGRLVFLVQHNKATEIHRLDPSTGREEILDLNKPANTISLAPEGYFTYWTGEHHLGFVDSNSFRQTAEETLPLPIYTAYGNDFSLSDGSIWETTVTDGQIHSSAVGQLSENERYSGFVSMKSKGQTMFYAIPADEQGRISGPLATHPSTKAF